MREVFISVPSFVFEAKVNASAMQFGSDDDGRHNSTKVVKLAGMDGEGERSIFISHKSGYDIVVDLNEELIASTASTSSPSLLSYVRGIVSTRRVFLCWVVGLN